MQETEKRKKNNHSAGQVNTNKPNYCLNTMLDVVGKELIPNINKAPWSSPLEWILAGHQFNQNWYFQPKILVDTILLCKKLLQTIMFKQLTDHTFNRSLVRFLYIRAQRIIEPFSIILMILKAMRWNRTLFWWSNKLCMGPSLGWLFHYTSDLYVFVFCAIKFNCNNVIFSRILQLSNLCYRLLTAHQLLVPLFQ